MSNTRKLLHYYSAAAATATAIALVAVAENCCRMSSAVSLTEGTAAITRLSLLPFLSLPYPYLTLTLTLPLPYPTTPLHPTHLLSSMLFVPLCIEIIKTRMKI